VSTFAPSLQDAGARVMRAPYAAGTAGHAQSLQVIAAKIREGSASQRISEWAGTVLRDAGLHGRTHAPIIRQQVQALLDAFRGQTVYAPDPVNKESIQSAEVTLCLTPNLCIPKGDCDDGVVAVGSATANLGITTMVIKEDFPNGEQSHVLLACRDEDGEWFTVDPSTLLSVGTSQSPKGTKRTWVNPMENAGAEIIGIGRPFTEGVEIISIDTPMDASVGVGADPQTPPTIPGTWSNVPDNVVHAGLRYAVAVTSPNDWTAKDVAKLFSPDWLVENVIDRPDLTTIRAWVMIGLARHDATLVDGAVGINAVLQEQPPPAAQPVPPPPPNTTSQPQQPPPLTGVPVGTVLYWMLGIAAVGGLGYGVYEYKKKHGRHLFAGEPKRRRLAR
jgi:hypothetical protein